MACNILYLNTYTPINFNRVILRIRRQRNVFTRIRQRNVGGVSINNDETLNLIAQLPLQEIDETDDSFASQLFLGSTFP
ncbi:16265_t:CDS:2 [Funneliformis mosseae]|uniref:16265_t:CDS:1 n=1 Tax=Funneliformis mosseae TaxID=27381 RepID=A0A9N9C5F3_FUNMO|nr:16265_t:CDS:2 [Funneliformis mosseae]